MTTFEVTIESPDAASVSLKVLVEADNWVEAWHQSLRVIGDPDAPDDAMCVLLDDHSVHVQAPSTRRTFVIREERLTPGKPITGPRPRPEVPVLITTLFDTEDGMPVQRKLRVHTPTVKGRRPITRNPAGRGDPTGKVFAPKPTPRHLPEPAAANVPAVTGIKRRLRPEKQPTDPVVRVLGQLEKARLAARPVVINPRTGLPGAQKNPLGSRANDLAGLRDAPTQIGLPVAHAERGHQKRTRHNTDPFATLASESLPQQFRAVGGATSKVGSVDEQLAKAIDTAWQHIDCSMAQVLRRAGDSLEVMAARGLLERETLTCTVDLSESLSQLRGTQASRVKFSEEVSIYYRALADTLEVKVRSALSVPIIVHERPYGVLLLLNSGHEAGFADGELRAVSYLGKTLGRKLASIDRSSDDDIRRDTNKGNHNA